MDEALEVVELVADSGLEGAIVWILRILGLLALLGGLGLWLLGEMSLLWIPAALIALGLVLLVVPQLLLFAMELFG